MTRKNYVTFARAFNKALAVSQTKDAKDAIEDLISVFMQIAKEDNPRFDEEIFKAAVFSKDLYKLNS